jgi:transposase
VAMEGEKKYEYLKVEEAVVDLSIKRLDHLGIVAGTIKDLKIIKLIDERLKKDNQAEVTQGEATVAMILNGLGFVSRVLMLAPQFFETKPIDILIRDGITEEQLNRHKLGRTLDAIAAYGCEALFNEIALSVCIQEKINLDACHNDTTSFSVNGEYNDQEDNVEVSITHGYSKDKRQDLKQIILELGVSRDGGIPFLMKPWSGNASDNKIFNERVKMLAKSIAESDKGMVHIADSKLYTQANIKALAPRFFITRVPSTIKEEHESIAKAIKQNSWTVIDDKNKMRVFHVTHYDVPQRWVVVYSQQANERAKKTVTKVCSRQEEQLKKELFHLQKQCFACEKDARAMLAKATKKYAYHVIENIRVVTVTNYEKRGRPIAGTKKEITGYRIEAAFAINRTALDQEIEQRSCYVLATNVPEENLSSDKIITEYKGQDCVEKGFAFLKSPSFFVASFFMKSTKRIQAMLVVMTLSLLIYAIAQRRLREYLKANRKFIPNQIKQPSQRPTLRWIFQCLEGIDYVIIKLKNSVTYTINGITDLRHEILSCFGESVKQIYKIS